MMKYAVYPVVAFLLAPSLDAQVFMGRDSSQWARAAPSASAAPNSNAALYAGGEFNISLAKTAVDAAGNVYAAGSQIVTIGTSTAHTVFVTKIDPSGATVYTTRLGGKGDDVALGLGVDASGRVTVGGYTTSPDFPLLHALQTEMSTTGTTAFVLGLDASGDLTWSTYFGGSGTPHGFSGSSVKAVAMDAAGNAYVTGTSQLPNFPITAGAYQSDGHFGTVTNQKSSGFVTKFSPSGQLVYSTWLGGSLIDCNFQGCFHDGSRMDAGTGIAVDGAGHAYVTGYSDTTDFPVTAGAFQTQVPQICPPNFFCAAFNEYYNAFLTELTQDGSGLIYSTFLGSLGTASIPPSDGLNKGITLDGAGDAYVAFGTTRALYDASAVPASAQAPPGGSDVLLLGLNPAGSALKLFSYLGGAGDDFVTGLALDNAGNLYVSGTTQSANFPDSYGLFPAGTDFLAELNAGTGKLIFSARLPGGLAAQDIALLSPVAGAVAAAGSSGHILRLNAFNAGSFPPVLGAGNAANGSIDGGLTPNEVVTIYGTGIGPAAAVTAQPTLVQNSVSAGSYPESLGGVQVSFNGQAAALLYVSADQINLTMPYFLTSPLTITIVNNGRTLGPFPVAAASQTPMPGIFHSEDGSAAALNQDGTLNSQANPAHGGSIFSIWGTGVSGLVNGLGGPDGGEIPAQAYDLSSKGLVSLSAGPNGYLPIPILYAGSAPGLVGGVFQINARVPQGLVGSVSLYLQASGRNCPVVTLFVAP